MTTKLLTVNYKRSRRGAHASPVVVGGLVSALVMTRGADIRRETGAQDDDNSSISRRRLSHPMQSALLCLRLSRRR